MRPENSHSRNLFCMDAIIVELTRLKWRFKHHFFKRHLYPAAYSESTVLRELKFNFKYFLTFYFVDETITIVHSLE